MAFFSEWKRFHEGRRRGLIGPFRQVNAVNGEDCCKAFLNEDGELAAQMWVMGGNSEKPSIDCAREFFVRDDYAEATKHIYLPTPEEQDLWDEEDDGTDENDPVAKCRAKDGPCSF